MTIFELLPSPQHAYTPQIDRAVWPLTSHVDEFGQLRIGGLALTEVAAEFRTPAYVSDETDFRDRIRRYRAALPGVGLVYAGKSLLTTAVARWVSEENLGLAVCSAGELVTALTAGMDPARIVMHGNAKTPHELLDAATVGVGRIVVDSFVEIALLAGRMRNQQRVPLRITPDIDVPGQTAVTTGVTDQKFGFSPADGQAAGAVTRILDDSLLDLVGLHCHIGSQITDAALYGDAIHRMILLMADVRARHGVTLTELNVGGSRGVPYVSGDPELDLGELADVIGDALDWACAAERFPGPPSWSNPDMPSARAPGSPSTECSR